MAVTSETNRVQYTGNNSTVTAYTVPFYFLESSHVVVVVTDDEGTETTLTGGQYTVTGAGDEEGGSLTTAVAYDNTHTVTITRVVPMTQPTIYEENTRFPASSHERALDRLTMQVQQMQRKLDRCIAATDVAAAQARIAISGITNQFLGVNSSGAFGLLTALQAQSILELQGSLIDKPTAFWADDGARAAKVPDFEGQIGLQLDTNVLWRSDGTSAGDWVQIVREDLSIGTAEIAADAITWAKFSGLGFFFLESAGTTTQTTAGTDYYIEFAEGGGTKTLDPLGRFAAGTDPAVVNLQAGEIWLIVALAIAQGSGGATYVQSLAIEVEGADYVQMSQTQAATGEPLTLTAIAVVSVPTSAPSDYEVKMRVEASVNAKDINTGHLFGLRIAKS